MYSLYFVVFFEFLEFLEFFDFFVVAPSKREIRVFASEIFSLDSFPLDPRQNANLAIGGIQHILKCLPLSKGLEMTVNSIHLRVTTAGLGRSKRPKIMSTRHHAMILHNQTSKMLLGIRRLQRLSEGIRYNFERR